MPVTLKVFGVTVMETVVDSVSYAEFVGTNVTDKVCEPAVSFVPGDGVYVN
jgi:hypothetical protein